MEVDEDLCFLRKGRGVVLVHCGFRYYRVRKYQNGSSIWRCSAREEGKFTCIGSLTLEVIITLPTLGKNTMMQQQNFNGGADKFDLKH